MVWTVTLYGSKGLGSKSCKKNKKKNEKLELVRVIISSGILHNRGFGFLFCICFVRGILQFFFSDPL